MGKKILMGVVAVIGGWLAGSIAMSLAHVATMFIWPLPEGLTFMDMMDPNNEDVRAFIEGLPGSAHFAAAVCHWIGAAVGAAIAMLIQGRSHIWPALTVAGIFMLGGVMNATNLPTPGWFLPVDAIGYPIVGFLVGKWLLRKPAETASA